MTYSNKLDGELMEVYLKFLKNLKKHEIQKLRENKLQLKLMPAQKISKPSSAKPNIENIDVSEARKKLNSINSREEGTKYLENHFQTKVLLQYLAKQLDIPFANKVNKNKLTHIIIENTIGFRLNSQAIQNKT